MKPKRVIRAQGQLRRSQLVTSFGPGSMLDLLNHSVIVSGLEYWGDPVKDGFAAVYEDRLLTKVREALENPEIVMFQPPVDVAGEDQGQRGIPVFQFPEWFVVQFENTADGIRSRRLVKRNSLHKGRYLDDNKKLQSVVPVRFVRACTRGHIDDVDWYAFVHKQGDHCRRPLWLDERGTSGDLTDIFVRCECGRSKPMAQSIASVENPAPLGWCNGASLWLGSRASQCGVGEERAPPLRLLVRSASNAYFPQSLSVIHIPPVDAKLKSAVDSVWADHLVAVQEMSQLEFMLKIPKVSAALEGLKKEEVFEELERRRSGLSTPDKSIKEAEMEMLLKAESPLYDLEEGEFSSSALPLKKTSAILKRVDRVVLVHRLREVTAQIGFTRFEPATPDIDGELELGVERAPISSEAAWVPAIENRGEGFLITFGEDILQAWLNKQPVAERVAKLSAGFEIWKTQRKVKTKFPGPRYVFLHSLSHLLIQSVSLACGYAASSIKERIYVTNAGSGILLYTGTPDAEGTLGGLVEVGRNIEEHLKGALELGALCANDPVCAQHTPETHFEERFLHGAACHGCLLIAETSCERRNDYLDRALVVPTVDENDAEFFTEDDL